MIDVGFKYLQFSCGDAGSRRHIDISSRAPARSGHAVRTLVQEPAGPRRMFARRGTLQDVAGTIILDVAQVSNYRKWLPTFPSHTAFSDTTTHDDVLMHVSRDHRSRNSGGADVCDAFVRKPGTTWGGRETRALRLEETAQGDRGRRRLARERLFRPVEWG